MSYPISEQLISYNRSGKKLTPQGFVIHSTDTPGATAQNEHDYFNSGDRKNSAHYFTDWIQIIRTIPENEIAWHAGATANSRFLSVEMSEPIDDPGKFQEVWNRTVWLVADACVRYGWNTRDNVFSHRGISIMYPKETDHTDPIEFLARYGKSWDDLLTAIDVKIQELKRGDTVDEGILIFGPDDFVTANRLAATLGNEVAIFLRKSDGTPPTAIKTAKHLYVIGGDPKGVGHPNQTVLAGPNWFATVAAVGKKLGY